jgi:glucokinase
MRYVIGVDFGGTHIRAALVDEEGQIVEQLKRKTLAELGTKAVMDRIADAIKEVAAHVPQGDEVVGVGAIAPGPSDPFTGVVFQAPNLPGWENVHLAEELHKRVELPVWIGNDANLAALAEHRYGAGRGLSDIVYVTVSTGIGGGIIVNHQMLLGPDGMAAEVGHMQIVPDGPLCNCGNRGCVEALASGPNIAREARARLERGIESSLSKLDHFPSTENVVQAAREGDELACDVIRRAGEHIGMMVANLVHLFNTQRFIFGGGVTNAGDLLLDPIRDTAYERTMKSYHGTFDVVPAACGDNVGILGAAALAFSMVDLRRPTTDNR